jgi:hypothetical protein
MRFAGIAIRDGRLDEAAGVGRARALEPYSTASDRAVPIVAWFRRYSWRGGHRFAEDLVRTSLMRLPRLFRKRRPAPEPHRMPGFDEAYYLRAYPDVERFPGPPLQHYRLFGWREGRDPSAGFSSNGYLAANPDVRDSGSDPLTHFLETGLSAGRTGWQKDPASPPPAPRFPIDQFEGPLRAFVEEAAIFMYWTSRDLAEPPGAQAWRALYPNFKVFTDRDVIPLLPEDFVPVFTSIRLPSAKSDIARFFLLRAHGGLYVDAHVGPTAPQRLMETLGDLTHRDMILFGKGWVMATEADFDLMNGVLAARRGARELDGIIDRLIGNVLDHQQKEAATNDYVPYDLFHLTGTAVIISDLFEQKSPRPQVKIELQDRISVHFMENNTDSGFTICAYYSYRVPNSHWSERQRHERFFLDAG